MVVTGMCRLLLKLASTVCISVIYYTVGYHVCGVFPDDVYLVGIATGMAIVVTYEIINATIGD